MIGTGIGKEGRGGEQTEVEGEGKRKRQSSQGIESWRGG